MARFFKAVLFVTAYLLAFDVAGVIVCFISEVIGADFTTLFYTIWFVAGVFCGLLGYDGAGRQFGRGVEPDWTSSPDANRWGLTTLALTLPLLLGLSVLFYKLIWEHGSGDGHYVPDSRNLTLLYFTTILGSMMLGHFVLRPKPIKMQ